MSLEIPFLGAYWGPRKESNDECAVRTVKFLQEIARFPDFTLWYLKGGSRRAEGKPLDLSPDKIKIHLKTNNRDSDGSPLQELGFRIAVWNGSKDLPASLSITCGAFSSVIKNSIVLDLPMDHVLPNAKICEAYLPILQSAVTVWDPDVAAITSDTFIERAGGGPPSKAGGWFTYRRGEPIERIGD